MRRRVLEIGAVASTEGRSAVFLSGRGARSVVAADSDIGAVERARELLESDTIRFRGAAFDDFPNGSFDLVAVADLAPYVGAPLLMSELSRLVAEHGYLLGGLRNTAGLALPTIFEAEEPGSAPTLGMLLDTLKPHFAAIREATQSPILGYQLAFQSTDGLQVDGSLAGPSEAAYFVVIAGRTLPADLDPTWVQLPPEPIAFSSGRLEKANASARSWRERSATYKRQWEDTKIRADELEKLLAECRKELALERTVNADAARSESDMNRIRDRERLALRIVKLEAELKEARSHSQAAK